MIGAARRPAEPVAGVATGRLGSVTSAQSRERTPAGPGWARPAPPSADLMLGMGQGSLGFLLASLGSCLILLARDLGVPRRELAWLSSGFGAALLLLGFTGERLLRVGARRTLRLSSFGLAVGAALLAAATSVHLAQAGALLLGLGGAGIVLTSPVLVAGPGSAARFTRANAASSLAGIGAPLLVGTVEGLSGHGRLALLLAVPPLLWIALRAGGPAGIAHAPSDDEPSPGAAPGGGTGWSAARSWLGMVAAVSPEFAFVVWGAARLQDSGLDAGAASAAAAAFPVGMAAGRLLAPRLLGRAPVVGIGVALALAGALLAAAPTGPILATAALGLAGLGIAPLYPVLCDQLVRTPGLPVARGAALGTAASGTAVLGAPMLLSALAGVMSLRMGYLAAAPVLVLVLVLHRRGLAAPGGPRR